jgi:hypothetical protein
MKRHGRLVYATVLVLSTQVIALAGGEDRDRIDAPTEAFLARWSSAAAKWDCVDVRLEHVSRVRGWEPEIFHDRLVLRKPNLASRRVSRSCGDGSTQLIERCVWTNRELHQFREQERQQLIWAYPRKREHVPELAALPFLFNMSTDELRTRYHVSLVRETADSAIVLLRPRSAREPRAFEKAIVELDSKSCLPRRFHLVAANDRGTNTWRALTTRVNQPVEPEAFRPDARPGWDVVRAPATYIDWLIRTGWL